MGTKLYAEVIVDIAAKKLDKIFHYSVPSSMQSVLKEGMRVIVPFGSRKLEGYILGFCDTPEVAETKDIIKIIEEQPLLSHDLLVLVGWISERYMCSKVDAIHAIMPAGARMVDYKYVVPANISANSEILGELKPLELDIYNYVAGFGKVSYEDVLAKFGDRKARETIKKLSERNILNVLGEMKAKVKPRLVQTLTMAVEENNLADLIASLETKAPKQARVLQTVKGKDNLGTQELARLAGVTASTVRELVKKGFLKVELTEIRRDPYATKTVEPSQPLTPNRNQRKALKEINLVLDQHKHETFLLHGVTGSGKTEIYLQAIAHCLDKGRQAIVLVPEISLTPQMVERFKARFGSKVAVFHSRLSSGERYDEWRQIKDGLADVVVGARSAVFAPFSDLGLIIIDEEHETSYKQEENPKYHARDVAIARAQLCNCAVVLGSATPSLESYTRAKVGRYKLLTLEERVKGQPLPEVTLVDLREEMQAGHRSIFSRLLIEKLSATIKRGEQAILFLNRRGHSTFVVCRECGLVMKCPSCSLTLTLHAGENLLRCHYCDFRRKAPNICPKCGSKSIRHFGIGTQKVEEEAAKWFPGARIARMDMDTTTRKGSHEKILNAFKEHKIDILIGTQMIAKGLDFPGVTLVGVITADTALNLPDFRAAERTFQLLTQVAGRAGRGDIPGEVIVQTYNPEHYSVINAQKHDYTGFYNEEMLVREALGYPPYCSMVRIVIYGTEENSVIRGAEILGERLRQLLSEYDLHSEHPMLGPAPAPINKLKNRFRWQICVRGKPGRSIRELVGAVLKSMEKDTYFTDLGISVDVDPVSIM